MTENKLMQLSIKSLTLYSAFLMIFFTNTFLLSESFAASSSYIKCWKNKENMTECGNRVPREYYNTQVRYIDNSGITRKIKERTKTQEEIEAQIELQQLQAKKDRERKKLVDYDRVLLKTYLTIDDLLGSLNSRLAIIESRSAILDSNLTIKKRKFSDLVKRAANIERAGKKIPKGLTEQLELARSDLKTIQNRKKEQQEETRKLKEVFAHDVERFILTKSQRIKYSMSSPSQSKKLRAAHLSCIDSQCDKKWQQANNFIKQYATTKILYNTNSILVTGIPIKNHDIAMSLSILDAEKKSEKVIIFQIRCNRLREGQEFCDGKEIKNLLKEFKTIAYN